MEIIDYVEIYLQTLKSRGLSLRVIQLQFSDLEVRFCSRKQPCRVNGCSNKYYCTSGVREIVLSRTIIISRSDCYALIRGRKVDMTEHFNSIIAGIRK